ncbi:Ras-related protein Rab-14 [Sparganum proliferum]
MDVRRTKRSTFNHIQTWLSDARRLTPGNTVVILIGNKSDLEDQRDVSYEDAKKLADENDLMFLECSAKSGENVEMAFLETAMKIYQNVQDGSVNLNSAEGGVLSKATAQPVVRLGSEGQPEAQAPRSTGCGC